MRVRRVGRDELTGPEIADAAALLSRLVAGGAALGWVDPPGPEEIHWLLTGVAGDDDAVLVVAGEDGRLHGLGYWRRYDRPTHRPHADVEKVAVDPSHQGHGFGRRIMSELIAAARDAGIEVLTLDQRADNTRAAALYESLGFRQYGRLERFVAVGDQRWDKLFYALRLTG
jgi:ribosomal protein S18 acetylase RimI-like enzyme